MTATLDIVIVNWNSGALLRDCLDSLAALPDAGAVVQRVVVVDNASTDGSADGLERPGLPLTVLRNSANRGFGAASNQGAAGSTAEILLFLNPDTRLSAGSLSLPLAELARPGRRGIGLLGTQLIAPTGQVARSCAGFPTPGRLAAQSLGLDRVWPRRFPPFLMTGWDHLETREVDHVMGAVLFVRRRVFEQLGGFDERFFVYLEDLDLSLRAARLGWRSLYLATARAVHIGGGTTDRIRATRLFYSLRSRILYGFKHFGPAGATLVAAATLLAEPVSRLALALARRNPVEAGQVLAGYGMLWADLFRRVIAYRTPRPEPTP